MVQVILQRLLQLLERPGEEEDGREVEAVAAKPGLTRRRCLRRPKLIGSASIDVSAQNLSDQPYFAH